MWMLWDSLEPTSNSSDMNEHAFICHWQEALAPL